MKNKFTLTQFHARFPDDNACLEELKQLVFGDTLDCPKCAKNNRFYRVKGRSAYACSFCGHHIYPLKGTPFAHSSTPLTTWFYAMYLMAQTRSGVSAKTLERMTGVTYKTAWRMFHQIRKLMGDDGSPLSGIVEVDETYFQPNPTKNTRVVTKSKLGKRLVKSKIVLGAVERGGRAKVWHVHSSGARVLLPKLIGSIAMNSTIYSDNWRAYTHLPIFHYTHDSINHSVGKYVNGQVHTQNIENLWSHAKLGIRGVYRHVGEDYLQAYINEYAFRYSHRAMPKYMFDLILERVASFSPPTPLPSLTS